MPRSIACATCGQMFLPSGLRFHEKVCQKRQHEMVTSCPYCGLEMAQVCLNGHIATCKAARRALESRRKESAHTGAGDATASFTQDSLSDGRVRCQFCGRLFTSMRIHEHVHICGALRQARPASIGGVRTQLPARVYHSAAARTTFSGSFDRQRQRLFISRAAAEGQGVLVRCAGVARKIGSQAAATIRPWTVLGVSRHATSAEVKSAYHRLAKEWHPDRHPAAGKAEAEARFKAVAEAYEAMVRPRRRPRPGRKQLALVAPESWRTKHEELVHAARSGRGAPTRGRQPLQGPRADSRIECPHCKRRFGEVQAERHIPKCATIVNKPSPPPPRRAQPVQASQLHARQPGSSPKAAQQHCSAVASSCAEFAQGMSVSIQGLSHSAHLNGISGVLHSYDTHADRWHVEVPGSDLEIAVKPENIRPLTLENIKPLARSSTAPRGPRPRNLVAQSPSKTFSGGFSCGRAGARSCGWADRPASQTSAKNHLCLVPGSKVRLDGLIGASHLNGLSGLLHHFDNQTSRWHVELPGGETKAIRPENLDVPGLRVCGLPKTFSPSASQKLARESSVQYLPAVSGYTAGRR